MTGNGVPPTTAGVPPTSYSGQPVPETVLGGSKTLEGTDNLYPKTEYVPNPKMADGSNYSNTDLPTELQGKYEYLGTVFTTGAESISYLCENMETKAQVVVKVYREDRQPNSTVLKRLQKAYDADKDVYITHLPIVIEYSENFEILEYLEGSTLKPTERMDVNNLVGQISSSVAYLHKQNIIHRDLKPTNMVYNKKNDTLKIIDFGIARVENGDDTSVKSKEGTPPYLDSESYDHGKIGIFADWWAVGMIVLENQIGHIPLSSESVLKYSSREEWMKAIIGICRDFKANAGLTNLLVTEVLEVENLNVRRLVLGLLQPRLSRWDNEAITHWLNGVTVDIASYKEFLGGAAADNLEYDKYYNGAFPVHGYSGVLADPDDIYNFLAHNYPQCNSLFSTNKGKFTSWVKGLVDQNVRNKICAQIDSEELPEYRGLVIQKILKPHLPLFYRGMELSSRNIIDISNKAKNQDQEAVEWLISVYDGWILGMVEAAIGDKGDGAWMQWQTRIHAVLTGADLFIDEVKIPSLKEYYNNNKMKYLYMAFIATISSDGLNSIVNNTNEKYDYLELDLLKDQDYVAIKRFSEEYIRKDSPAKLFIAIVVFPDLIRMVEARRADRGITAEGIELDENFRFRRRKSFYRQAQEGIPFFGPSTKDELLERLNRQPNIKHDLLSAHKLVDYSSLVPSFEDEKPLILKGDSPPIEKYSVSDAEAASLFNIRLKPLKNAIKPAPAEIIPQEQIYSLQNSTIISEPRNTKLNLFQKFANFVKGVFK